MIFIFPHNYNFKTKLLGIIDYSTLFLNLFWIFIIFLFSKLFNFNLIAKITFFIITCMPIFLFSLTGFNHENIFYVICYLIKFIVRNKLYLYKK